MSGTNVVILTLVLTLGLAYVYVDSRRAEITSNWQLYRMNPFVLFMAPLFKPADDPRSRLQFGADNFIEVIRVFIDKILAVVLAPVFQMFNAVSDAVNATSNGLFNIKALMSKLLSGFNQMIDVFQRRFNMVGHELRMVFVKLFNAIQKTWASAAASIYAGLSTISAMLGMMRLMITIAITILVILVVLVFWFFFTLWPLIPLIVLGGVMVGEVASKIGMNNKAAGATRSIACFAADTPICTPTGSVRIANVQPGQVLRGGATVTGVLHFQNKTEPIYTLWGVKVTGSHIVYDMKVGAIQVADHPEAVLTEEIVPDLYCLLTSDRKIPILTHMGVQMFADWEELDADDDEALRSWHSYVVKTLNGATAPVPEPKHLDVEAGLSGAIRIQTPGGLCPVSNLRPGSRVLTVNGGETCVTGVVYWKGDAPAVPRGEGFITTGCWEVGSLASPGPGPGWKQPNGSETLDTHWWHLFTEDGTFVAEGVGMRDFSDVGPVALEATYESVVQRLREKSTPLESNVLQQDDSSADAPRIAASCECVDAVRIHKLSGVV
jgi:hypothetical protein